MLISNIFKNANRNQKKKKESKKLKNNFYFFFNFHNFLLSPFITSSSLSKNMSQSSNIIILSQSQQQLQSQQQQSLQSQSQSQSQLQPQLPKTIQLRPNQLAHYERVCSIVKREFAYLDTSPYGAGKTYVAMKLAWAYNLAILVFAPLILVQMWLDIGKEYGIRIIDALSYRKLGGTEKSGCNHPYLYRYGDDYYPTPYFTQLVNSGILLVFDEVQNLKTEDTNQAVAAHAMVKEVVRLNSGSRVGLLSRTPIDKNTHVESLVKNLGIVTSDNLYNYDRSRKFYELTGMKELYAKCDSLDYHKSQSIHSGVKITRKNVTDIVYELYTQVLKPFMSSAMPKLDNKDVSQDIKNGYYVMTPEDLEEVKAGQALLESIVHYNPINGTVTLPKNNWSDIVNALTNLEKAKCRNLIPRLVREWLGASPNNKGIIFLWRVETILYLREVLREFNPMIIYGDTCLRDKNDIVAKFQRPTNEFRLLIANALIGCVGLSLDDQDGRFPRTTWIVPSYNFIHLSQAPGRTYRELTKSDSIYRVIFCKDFISERQIVDVLARKSGVVRDVIYDDSDIILPDDYEDYIEGVGVVPRANRLQLLN